jgi:flagellar protein FliS
MQPANTCYQQTQITTATPEHLLLMLHDGAIRYVAQSRQAIEVGEAIPKRESVSRAMAIVSYLADTLDHEAGWDSSLDLDGLYGFMINELTKDNLKNDLQSLQVVEGLLQGLRGTWAEAIEIVRKENAPV